MEPQPLSIPLRKAAPLVGVSLASLYRLAQRGEGPPTFRVGARRLVRLVDLESWLAARAAETEP